MVSIMYSQAVQRFTTQHQSSDSGILSLPQHQTSNAPCADVSITVTHTPLLLLFLTLPSNFSSLTTWCLCTPGLCFPMVSFWLLLATVLCLLSWGLFTSLLLLFCIAHSLRRRLNGLRKALSSREYYFGQCSLTGSDAIPVASSVARGWYHIM